MKKTIKLPNRYGYNVQLVQLAHLKNNIYKLVLPEECDNLRLIYSEGREHIMAIDPSGGPFIAVGEPLFNGDIVEDIIWDNPLNCWEIKLKHNVNSNNTRSTRKKVLERTDK